MENIKKLPDPDSDPNSPEDQSDEESEIKNAEGQDDHYSDEAIDNDTESDRSEMKNIIGTVRSDLREKEREEEKKGKPSESDKKKEERGSGKNASESKDVKRLEPDEAPGTSSMKKDGKVVEDESKRTFEPSYPRTYEAKIITKSAGKMYTKSGPVATDEEMQALSDVEDIINTLENNQSLLVQEGLVKNPELYQEYEANKQTLKAILSQPEKTSVQFTTTTPQTSQPHGEHYRKIHMDYFTPPMAGFDARGAPNRLDKQPTQIGIESKQRPRPRPRSQDNAPHYIDCSPGYVYVDMIVPFVQPENVLMEYEKNVILVTGFHEAKDKTGQKYKSFGKKIVVPKNTDLTTVNACLCWDPLKDLHKICIEAPRR